MIAAGFLSLVAAAALGAARAGESARMVAYVANWEDPPSGEMLRDVTTAIMAFATTYQEIGRASCRERV